MKTIIIKIIKNKWFWWFMTFAVVIPMIFFYCLWQVVTKLDNYRAEIRNEAWEEGYEVGRYDELVYQDEIKNLEIQEAEERKWSALSTNPEIPRLLKQYFKDYATARIIYAVARAESSGNQMAVNKNTNLTYDSGWLQVNSIHKNKGESDQEFVARMHILEENIRLASIVYKKQGFNAWVMYKNGEYKKYLK